MDIGVCGFGYSGSGAVIDLLKEYSDVRYADGCELFITYFPDGLIDLYYNTCVYHSKFFNSDTAIKRFLRLCRNYGNMFGWDDCKKNQFFSLAEKFVNSILTCNYRGYWAIDLMEMNELNRTLYFRIGNRLNNILNQEYIVPPNEIFYSYNPENFIEQAKEFILSIKSLLGYEKLGKCVFNQPFAADNPEASFPFYDHPRAILVVRDPRDVFVMAKRFLRTSASWIPYRDVNSFIKFYRTQCSNIECRENVLVIRFEDLVYKYEDTKRIVEDFLCIKDHVSQKIYFKPAESVRNTRLYEKFPEYEDDIEKIKKDLPEYLYDYSEVELLNNTGKCFWD